MVEDESASLTPISGHGPRAAADEATVISPTDERRPVSTAEIGQTLEGSMLGPYRLDRFIGGGGMGAVFRALDTTLDRTVAVKVLAERRADDEEMLRRFRNEAQSAARLDHENIGRVHAVGSERGWHFIVFEFIEGTNLRELVREQGPLDLARTVDIGIQIADALEHAARRDVVHRDIKPSNIVITPAGRARLVDMGLARLHQVTDDEFTSSGMTIGTFDYISPEQARDPRAADVRSDLYSLGCTLFFLLAGRTPFAEGTMVQKLLQHQHAPPPSIDALRPDVPRSFAAILERLMAKDPGDRYQRPTQLAADLAAFAESAGLGAVAKRQQIDRRPAVREPSSLTWLLPLLGLSLIVGGLWFQGARERHERVEAARLPVAAASSQPGIVRVVAEPVGDGEADSIAAALGRVADGGMIELAYDGERSEPPLSLGGRRLTIQAAEDRRPAIRFVEPADTAAHHQAAACDVGAGELVIRRVRIACDLRGRTGRPCLFAVDGGRLLCEESILLMSAGGESDTAVFSPPEAAIVSVAPGERDGDGAFIRLDDTRVAGDASLIDASAGTSGSVTVHWAGGQFVSTQPLVRGTGSREQPGIDITCELNDVVVVCDRGAVLLADGPETPIPARFSLTAVDSRFLVDDGRALVERVGRADASTYRKDTVWNDVRGRYEGGVMLLRIDAPSGRSEEPLPTGLLRLPRGSDRPDPSAWEMFED